MNKTVSALLFIIAAIFASSCSSDNGGNDNKDKKKIKTIYVSVAPKMETPAGHDFAEGDVMYACNGSVGEKSLLSVLKYDEASGCFKGNFQYVAGDEFIIGNLYIGGCPLKKHWYNAENDKGAYRYRKINADGKLVQKDNIKISAAIAEEDWDYISLQQASGVSGLTESYEPYLAYLVAYIKTLAPGSKIVWHQTWAYSKTSTHGEFPNYERNQTKMYEMIMEASQKGMRDNGIKKVIPSGTAVQNARNTFIGDNMNRDGYHLNLSYGRYTAACTWFEALTGKNVTKNTYAPADVDARTAQACRCAAHDAVKHPWKVTLH